MPPNLWPLRRRRRLWTDAPTLSGIEAMNNAQILGIFCATKSLCDPHTLTCEHTRLRIENKQHEHHARAHTHTPFASSVGFQNVRLPS